MGWGRNVLRTENYQTRMYFPFSALLFWRGVLYPFLKAKGLESAEKKKKKKRMNHLQKNKDFIFLK